MKFTLLMRHDDEVVNLFKHWQKDGYVRGIKMIKLDEVDVIDKDTNEHLKPAYAIRCEGSLFWYLAHRCKTRGRLTHIKGW